MGVKHKINHVLELRRWTPNSVAVKAKIPPSTMNTWLNGPTENIKLEYLFAVVRQLGVSLDWVSRDDLPDNEVPAWAWQTDVPPAPPQPATIIGPQEDITDAIDEAHREKKKRGRPKKARAESDG